VSTLLKNLPHRQLHIENGAFASAFALGPNPAVMGFDNLISKVKANSLVYGGYFLSGCVIPRSRQIFFAKKLSISVWRGTVEDFLTRGLKKTLCLAPSLIKTHPFLRRCLIKSFLLILRKLKVAPESLFP
jgi:hypothetical protein